MWLEATRVSTAPGRGFSRLTVSPVATTASERVVGIPEGVHGLADDVFAQDRAERGSAVAIAGERGGAGTLELDVAARPIESDDLAKKKDAAVTQLRDEVTKLMAGIGHGQRFAELGYGVAGKDGDTLRRGKPGGIEPELSCERLVQPDEEGRGDGGRRQTRKEPLRQPRVAVVKGKDVRWFD